MPKIPKTSQSDKCLIIGPSWVGDMVMSQSLYKRLIEKHPGLKIDVLAPGWCKPILDRMPEVHEAIEMPLGHGKFELATRWKIGRELRDKNYIRAYILPNSAKSALIPFFAKIPKRIGWKGEMRFGLLNDLRPNRKVFQYMVERYVALAHEKDAMLSEVHLKDVPYPILTVDSANQSSCLTKFGITQNDKIVGICPGAEFGPAKRWPISHYAEVAKYLISEGEQICFFGGQKDKIIAQAIVDSLPLELQCKCYNLAGETTLVDAVDMLAACHTVFSNDSGLMHVAAAVGSKIVAIYGSSSPQYTPALSEKVAMVNSDIKCRPCFQRECPLGHLKCLSELTPETVIRAYKEIKDF